jgi:hypothetical protein
MVQVECVATKGYVAFICMPLLTELVSTEDGFCYKHGAPKGAVSTRQQCIARKAAKNLALRASAHGRRSWVQMISNDQELQAPLERVRQKQDCPTRGLCLLGQIRTVTWQTLRVVAEAKIPAQIRGCGPHLQKFPRDYPSTAT